MAEIHVNTRRPDGHSILPTGRLTAIEREPTRTMLHLAGQDWSVTVEITTEEAEIMTAALRLLEEYPSVHKITA